jgi:hypothetical protein
MAFKTNNSMISRETGLISTKSALDLTSTASSETTLISGSGTYALSIAIGQNKFVIGDNNDDIRVYDFDGTLLNSLAPNANDNYYQFTSSWGRYVGIDDNIIIFNSHQNGVSGGAIFATDLQLNAKWKIHESSKDDFAKRVHIGEGRILVTSFENGSTYNDQGYVYIYDYNGNFIRRITFSHNNPYQSGQKFGMSLSIGNGRILVGAPAEYSSFNNGDNIHTSGVGFCYLYDLDGNFIKRFNHYNIIDGLTNASYYTSSFFGQSASIGNGKIVVGAPTMDRGNKTKAGRVFTFDINGENGAELLPSAPGQTAAYMEFGSCVKIGCGRIFVSAPKFNSNGNAANSGKIFEFDLDGNELGQIILSDYASGDQIGSGGLQMTSLDPMAVGNGKFAVFRNAQNTKTFHFDVPPIEDYFSKFTK